MPEEYPAESERSYSAFWPLLIFLAAFVLVTFYQFYGILAQRSLINKQYDLEAPNAQKADDARAQFSSIVKDLVATSNKDNNAALVLRQGMQAGFLHPEQNTNAAAAASATP
jgi:type II secretory pathway component PulL